MRLRKCNCGICAVLSGQIGADQQAIIRVSTTLSFNVDDDPDFTGIAS